MTSGSRQSLCAVIYSKSSTSHDECHTTLALWIKSYNIIFLLYFVDTATSQWYFLLYEYNTELSETKWRRFGGSAAAIVAEGDSFSAFRKVA
jgi:hypothetical protein